jgi:hypothetical protein
MRSGIGMRVAADVADAMLAKRLAREKEEEEAGKSKGTPESEKRKPGQYGLAPGQTFDRGASESAYQVQRAGERADYSGLQDATAPTPSIEPTWELTPEMVNGLQGSRPFTQKEVMRGYRTLPMPRKGRKK